MLKGSKKINDKAEVFKFRLTKDEREKLKRLAEEKNCSSGELLRRYINDEYKIFDCLNLGGYYDTPQGHQ